MYGSYTFDHLNPFYCVLLPPTQVCPLHYKDFCLRRMKRRTDSSLHRSSIVSMEVLTKGLFTVGNS